jgi:hypothetical protein
MIDYTARLIALMDDIVRRVPALGFIDMRDVLVFARHGRRSAGGAFATCHSLDLPPSEPDRYVWTDRRTGAIVRQSEWFVARSPMVRLHGRRIRHLLSFALPRFSDETLERSGKRASYPDAAPWLAKLDTVVHELYHIDPGEDGIRRAARADGKRSRLTHGPGFHRDVAAMVRAYLATRPDPWLVDFLQRDFMGVVDREGVVLATTFRTYPSFPQRYLEALNPQPPAPAWPVVRLARRRQPVAYTELDLVRRRFKSRGAPVPWREEEDGPRTPRTPGEPPPLGETSSSN